MTSVKLSAVPLSGRAPVLGTYDGDTIHVAYIDAILDWRKVPHGGSQWILGRLAGIAARELHYPDDNGKLQPDEGGFAAGANLAQLLGTQIVTLLDPHPDEYGNRMDAWVLLPDGTSLNDRLVADGWALPWNGQGVQPKPAWPRVPAQGAVHAQAAREWTVGA